MAVELVCLMGVVGFCFVVCSKYCGSLFDFSVVFGCKNVGCEITSNWKWIYTFYIISLFYFRSFFSQVSVARLTCGNFGKILLLLGRVPKQQDALEADGLVGSQRDAHAQVVAAHDLNQPGVLWTPEAVNQSESSHTSTHKAVQPVTSPLWSVRVPECWTGRDRPGPTAPASQRHPSPSAPPWCDPLLSPGHRFWQGRSLPDACARQKSHRNVKVKRLQPGNENRILNYLKEFSNRPNKLAEKLLLLIVHCCQHRQLFRKVQLNFFQLTWTSTLREFVTPGVWKHLGCCDLPLEHVHGKRLGLLEN